MTTIETAVATVTMVTIVGATVAMVTAKATAELDTFIAFCVASSMASSSLPSVRIKHGPDASQNACGCRAAARVRAQGKVKVREVTQCRTSGARLG